MKQNQRKKRKPQRKKTKGKKKTVGLNSQGRIEDWDWEKINQA